MSSRLSTVCALATALLLASCQRDQTPMDLTGRLNAANEITDTQKRDSALVAVATAAGQAGNGPIALGAIRGVADAQLRSQAAAIVALALAAAGKSQDAVLVAKKINDTQKRNATMERIAK